MPPTMRPIVPLLLMLTTLSFVALVPTAAADSDDDPPLADCRRVLFLHWVDYSHHYACIDGDGDLQDGECTAGYKRQAPDGTNEWCIV